MANSRFLRSRSAHYRAAHAAARRAVDKGQFRGACNRRVHGGWRCVRIFEDCFEGAGIETSVALHFDQQQLVGSRLGHCYPISDHRLHWRDPGSPLLAPSSTDDGSGVANDRNGSKRIRSPDE